MALTTGKFSVTRLNISGIPKYRISAKLEDVNALLRREGSKKLANDNELFYGIHSIVVIFNSGTGPTDIDWIDLIPRVNNARSTWERDAQSVEGEMFVEYGDSAMVRIKKSLGWLGW